MQNVIYPQQTRMFVPFDSVSSLQFRLHLLESWPEVFRYVLIKIMSTRSLSEHLDRVRGQPGKELYSITRLIILKVAGWYVLRVAVSVNMRKNAYETACQGIFGLILTILMSPMTAQSLFIDRKTKSQRKCSNMENYHPSILPFKILFLTVVS
ncbi:MAG: hypothetical protein GY799_31870 [Desulfobulbaceae bacterium]|nr:hypothetical protein [Desulfobulbaceae bacterium]